jgi:hypothetical protein
MRIAVAAAILITAFSQLPPPATAATRGDVPTVASRARRCERIARRLAAGERRALARPGCGVAEGCTGAQQRRWARLASSYADDCVALNHVQVLGTHNSYHIEPRPELLAALLAFTHPPLAHQFGDEAIRQIELDTEQARSGDTTDRDAALASGAQYVSTDYRVLNPDFGTGYFVEIPDGAPGRCNPINAPVGCRSSALERPF